MQRVVRILLAVGIAVAAILGVLHLPIISVRAVVIDPSSDVDHALRDEILAYTESVLSKRVYGIPGRARHYFYREDFEDMLRERFLRVRAVTIHQDFFNVWSVTAKRRHAFGTYCDDKHCVVADTDGFVFMETDIQVGSTLNISDRVRVGEHVFGTDEDSITDFKKIPEIVTFLEHSGILVNRVSLRRDTRVVHVDLANGIGIWLDASEALYDTTRALHIVFEEVFSDPKKRINIMSVDVRNPLSILYEEK